MIIKLTKTDGDSFYINTDVIAYFYAMSHNTLLQLKPVVVKRSDEETDNYFLVKETPEQICELIGVDE